MAQVINDSNFAEVLAQGKPVLIDFWATWCGPCRAMAPVVDELAAEFEGRVIVAKCDVDASEETATACGIRNIPTFLFYKDGQLVDRLVGVNPKGVFVEKLNALL
ncbi:MAG: thioredoxin [Bacteroidales bacterium]|nr:thioredoxin [Bacteroidales bacterium]